jgi:hypothetical protein
MHAWAQLAELQLKRAGVRLAVTLNDALGATPNIRASAGARTVHVHAPVIAARSPLTGPISPTEAVSHVGQTTIVEGGVSEVHGARGGTTFLNIGARYPDNAFAAVIFPEDRSKFRDLQSLSGRIVDITGRIQLYRGKPEIILRSADQVKAKWQHVQR